MAGNDLIKSFLIFLRNSTFQVCIFQKIIVCKKHPKIWYKDTNIHYSTRLNAPFLIERPLNQSSHNITVIHIQDVLQVNNNTGTTWQDPE